MIKVEKEQRGAFSSRQNLSGFATPFSQPSFSLAR